MLMVILGAGSSFDSVDSKLDPQVSAYTYDRPPLAKELFDARINFGAALDELPDLSSLVNRLRRAVGRGDQLEATLKEIEEEAGDYPYRHRQLLALRCYLQHIIAECGTNWMRRAHGITHFAELVDEIERWRILAREQVCYVSFNYDTMLEAVLGPRFGAAFVDINSYTRPEFTLLKLHGSVDWAHRVSLPVGTVLEASVIRTYLFEWAGEYTPSHIVKVSIGQWIFEKDGLIPAIAIPVQAKKAFECPEQHLTQLKQAIAQTTRVITIGWRGVEEHFLELWKNRNDFFDLLVVSGSADSGRETLANITKGQMLMEDNRYRRIAFDGGFGDVLESGKLRSFLDSGSVV